MTQKSEAGEREALMADAAQIAYAAYSADYDAEPEIRALVDRALLARAAAPAEQEPTINYSMLYEWADQHDIDYNGLCRTVRAAVAAPQSRPGEAATARDAARYRWLRDVASHEWLATGPITDASVDAALSSNPARVDDGATGADLPDGAQR